MFFMLEARKADDEHSDHVGGRREHSEDRQGLNFFHGWFLFSAALSRQSVYRRDASLPLAFFRIFESIAEQAIRSLPLASTYPLGHAI